MKKIFQNILFIFFFVGININLSAEEEAAFYGKIPDFSLIDQSKEPFGLENLKGKVWIANFIFTRCQTMCPLMSRKFSMLQERIGPEIFLISFSVDPEYDKTDILQKYANEYGAEDGKWFFLTGDRAEIWELTSGGFYLGVDRASKEELKAGAQPILHSEKFVLIDREANIRGYYDSSNAQELERIVKDANKLLKS